MPLFKLHRTRTPLREGETISFVIRADTAARARQLAADEDGPEWNSPAHTSITQVESDERIILRSTLKGAPK